MKVKKILKIIFVLVILFTFTLILYLNNTVKLNNFEIQLANTKRIEQKDVYDVILFFGQSNMAGNMSQGIETRYQLDNQASVKEYSEKTGISEDLINQSWVSNYTVPKIDKETCYEYHVLDNSLYDLYDLTSNGYTANGAEITVNKFNGELVYYSAETNGDLLEEILSLDDGATSLGDFGIGLNFGITGFCGDILYDEKIGGTIHFAMGRGYPECLGNNGSALHWDIIKDTRREGAVYLDGRKVMENGQWFV